ncbi:hypothetical protein F511_14875 [Dorcoceras hygrometricum]|uniref:Uncharacterized protein n=1 Tax=Dorcoceras hygrometricum TaxID=472368 RepID=A0A2Z7AQB5_9LAMI|nr:hypothetical protein F511_14875 [Dorcoceras hygrometricum]
MSIELQSDFSKGKSGNVSSDELIDCVRSVDAKISRAGRGLALGKIGRDSLAKTGVDVKISKLEQYINQLVGDQLGMEQSWSLGADQVQERTEQAQLQTKRGADVELLKNRLKMKSNQLDKDAG